MVSGLICECQPLLMASEAPVLTPESSKTSHILAWSQNVVKQFREGQLNEIEQSMKTFERSFEFLRALPAKSVLQNKNFFADLQKIQQQFTIFLFEYGKQGIASGRLQKDKVKTIFEKMSRLKAPGELKRPFLWQMGEYESYYEITREVLEKWESHPERLLNEPEIPPPFVFKSSYSLQTYQHMVSIYDICIKSRWLPDQVKEFNLLKALSSGFERHKVYNQAIDVLSMAKHPDNKKKFMQRVRLLKEKSRSSMSAEELY